MISGPRLLLIVIPLFDWRALLCVYYQFADMIYPAKGNQIIILGQDASSCPIIVSEIRVISDAAKDYRHLNVERLA